MRCIQLDLTVYTHNIKLTSGIALTLNSFQPYQSTLRVATLLIAVSELQLGVSNGYGYGQPTEPNFIINKLLSPCPISVSLYFAYRRTLPSDLGHSLWHLLGE